MTMPAIIIVLLIALNAAFVAAEFAIIGAPRAALEHRARRGSRVARGVLDVQANSTRQDRYVATAQLGITFASLGLGMYGENRLAGELGTLLARLGIEHAAFAHSIASVVAVTLLTCLHIVVGEMIPKTLALQHAEATALWLSTPMRWIELALWPLVVGLNAIGRGVLQLFGVRREAAVIIPSSGALRFAVEESVMQGELDPDAGHVLGELFEFSQLSAGRIMTPRMRVIGLRLGASANEIRAAVRSARHARYLVYEETLDRVLGLVLIRDLLQLLVSGQALARGVVRPVPFVPATAKLDVVLARMRKHKTQLVVVMDEHGGTSGIVTAEDVFGKIIGEMSDGPTAPWPVFELDGELRALGIARLAQVGGQLGLDLQHPDVDTVSGLFLTLLDRPAEVGDQIRYRGLSLVAQDIRGRGVRECTLRVEPHRVDARGGPQRPPTA